MNYDIKVDQETTDYIVVILDQNENPIEEVSFSQRSTAIKWLALELRDLNPEGPVRMTRKKVYNDRVIGRPMFWEITTYNAKGERLHSGQYNGVIQEGYLRGLVQDQFGFPLEAAEEIE